MSKQKGKTATHAEAYRLGVEFGLMTRRHRTVNAFRAGVFLGVLVGVSMAWAWPAIINLVRK